MSGGIGVSVTRALAAFASHACSMLAIYKATLLALSCGGRALVLGLHSRSQADVLRGSFCTSGMQALLSAVYVVHQHSSPDMR